VAAVKVKTSALGSPGGGQGAKYGVHRGRRWGVALVRVGLGGARRGLGSAGVWKKGKEGQYYPVARRPRGGGEGERQGGRWEAEKSECLHPCAS
jgi:hypothetical protein